MTAAPSPSDAAVVACSRVGMIVDMLDVVAMAMRSVDSSPRLAAFATVIDMARAEAAKARVELKGVSEHLEREERRERA